MSGRRMSRTALPVRPDWEVFLQEHFPGFLLPKNAHHRVTPDVARAFLEALGLPGRNLSALRTMSLLASRDSELRDFACYWLPELVRVLPSRALVKQRVWRGGYQGRLDARATLARHIGGEPDVFVTRGRHRDFNLPENVFVRSLASRTVAVLEAVQSLGLLHGEEWTGGSAQSLASLRMLLSSTVLREVDEGPVDAHQLRAAANARHPAFRSALSWHEALTQALDSDDPERLAKLLSDGALRPMAEAKRFEIAVLLTLLQTLEVRLSPESGWDVSRDIIVSGRQAIATFRRENESLRVFYDQAILPLNKALGPRDRGVAHYLGSSGRLRPDITIERTHADGSVNFVVFELKLTNNPSYAASGYSEAIVYCHEYAEHLHGWPKAVLVTSCPVHAEPSREHDVVAVHWASLAESSVIAGLLEKHP